MKNKNGSNKLYLSVIIIITSLSLFSQKRARYLESLKDIEGNQIKQCSFNEQMFGYLITADYLILNE